VEENGQQQRTAATATATAKAMRGFFAALRMTIVFDGLNFARSE
jgi:hypothetical protein